MGKGGGGDACFVGVAPPLLLLLPSEGTLLLLLVFFLRQDDKVSVDTVEDDSLRGITSDNGWFLVGDDVDDVEGSTAICFCKGTLLLFSAIDAWLDDGEGTLLFLIRLVENESLRGRQDLVAKEGGLLMLPLLRILPCC